MDGNCFFWAVTDQLEHLDIENQSCEELRHAVVNYINNLPEAKRNEMLEFLTTPFNNYVDAMKTNRTYAYHFVIQAMRSMLGSAINIIQQTDADEIQILFMRKTAKAGLNTWHDRDQT
ncbi:hypothetical protein DPMN_044892 [Dreissena polymorpha]|uniref:OTU domain-containing protein n=1 Tax=Dreissena polymorpha TaxID=45954 RepID=A0A9D4D5F6_DREPO|nr:hypothetical protein DPMN_044892 [Dreissena polymorpha]